MTGSTSLASAHVSPPSVLTSTRVMRPRPDHAMPRISHGPRAGIVPTLAVGQVMVDFASMEKVNWRAELSGIGSVYLDVSSRVSNGWSPNFRRRNHLILMLPSQPGSIRRAG